MIRTCTAEDIKFREKLLPPEAPCGRTYDDVERSTICPHNLLPPKKTLEELEQMVRDHGLE